MPLDIADLYDNAEHCFKVLESMRNYDAYCKEHHLTRKVDEALLGECRNLDGADGLPVYAEIVRDENLGDAGVLQFGIIQEQELVQLSCVCDIPKDPGHRRAREDPLGLDILQSVVPENDKLVFENERQGFREMF